MVFALNQTFTKDRFLLWERKIFGSYLLLVFLIVFSGGVLHAQQREGVEITAGFELRGLVPVSFFTPEEVTLREPDGNFTASYIHKTGLGFGGVVRLRLTDFWNIESGIYYTRRVLEYQIDDPSVNFSATTPVRIIGYEIPLKGLVYIQMGKQVFMDVALGLSADFFASDTEVLDPKYAIVTFKKSWIRPAILGNVGVEFRTDESGYFYLGATFHQPFGDIMTTQVNYLRNADPPAYFQNGLIDGTYFSVDFRYFFPPQKPKGNKVRYSKPDWKNLK